MAVARVLITGARGMLGQRLVEAFSGRHEVLVTARSGERTLDITDEAAVAECVAAFQPDWIVNAAAYTAVDKAETEVAEAFRINEHGSAVLARAAGASGAVLLHVSTDFVFAGTASQPYDETQPVAPVGVYACSKEAGERAVRRFAPDHVILRVAWLFGPGGKNFVDTILKFARERGALRVVADQYGTPTFTRDAAEAALRVLERGLRGTVHAANTGVVSWHGLAVEACRLAGIAAVITPITTAEWPTPAPRPAYSALRNRVLEESLGMFQRPWQDALAEHVALRGEVK